MNLDAWRFCQTYHFINQQTTLTLKSNEQSRLAHQSELIVVRLSDPQSKVRFISLIKVQP
jgi:hypothetical protein